MDGDEDKNLFFEEMQRFKDITVEKIENILREDKYDLMVEILGLASIVSALIVTYSQSDEEKKQYFDTVIYMFEQHQQRYDTDNQE